MNEAATNLLVRSSGFGRRYDMLGAVKPNCAKARWIDLTQCVTAGQAFRKIVSECCRHLSLNQQLFLVHRHGEALHQARVAVRRIRTALPLIGQEIGEDQPALLRSELHWISELLGAARDMDVFIEREVDTTGCSVQLWSQLCDRRDLAFENAAAGLGSDRFRMMTESLLYWIDNEPEEGAHSSWRRQKPDIFAAEALTHNWQKLMRRGRNLRILDDKAIHRVRLAAKKLRYSNEFFRSLFESARPAQHAEFEEALAKVQERLGRLNDMITANSLANAIINQEVSQARGLPVILLTRDVPEQKCDLVVRGEAALRSLHDLGPYW